MPKAHWLEYVKDAAVRAVMAEKPCDYIVGTVTSVKPLRIKLSDSDGLELDEEFFHLARNVTDYTVTISVSGDERKVKVHNALKKGDKVMMVRKWGGQDFIVTDRVVE